MDKRLAQMLARVLRAGGHLLMFTSTLDHEHFPGFEVEHFTRLMTARNNVSWLADYSRTG
jgi:hypothetical protein